MTKADKIRSMTDEELANFLEAYEIDQCSFCTNVYENCDTTRCREYFIDWLQSEVKEEGAG